jgi:PKD repeat protein
MSIVAVHGPTMYSPGTGNVSAPQVTATGDPTNGLKFTFVASTPGARPAADFDWDFTGGTPATALDTKGPVVVTYATAGAKTATLTVAAGAGPPAGGSYPITVQAVSGARSVEE